MVPHLPPLEPLLPILDVAGLAVFAASGALAAARAKLDIIAACFFAAVTATGGGTMRDLLIGAPVFWVHDATPLLVALAVALVVWPMPRRWWPERMLDWLDAVGLATYATYGAGKAIQFGIPPLPAAAMGIFTASLGGIIRDVLAGVPSILLRHELYVSAAMLASGLFVGLTELGLARPWPAVIGAGAGFALRGATIVWGLALRGHRG